MIASLSTPVFIDASVEERPTYRDILQAPVSSTPSTILSHASLSRSWLLLNVRNIWRRVVFWSPLVLQTSLVINRVIHYRRGIRQQQSTAFFGLFFTYFQRHSYTSYSLITHSLGVLSTCANIHYFLRGLSKQLQCRSLTPGVDASLLSSTLCRYLG
jgi:hypothetical protein